MKQRVWMSIMITMGIGIPSCGYTVLQKHSDEGLQPKGLELLPDLVIKHIGAVTARDVWMDDPDDFPTTTFYVEIVNTGNALFKGRAAIAWTHKEDDFAAQLFRYIGYDRELSLSQGESATLKASKTHRSYPIGARLKFTILTDVFERWMTQPPYKFGNTPHRELDYKNNSSEYVVQ